ncbi:MAG: DUF6056 family protein [Lachnospiraceae bacterium]|nr:DUF6056 family protein [Lachnospiraceae bacterium]
MNIISDKKKKRIEIAIAILLWFTIIILIIPFLLAASKAVFKSDDFSGYYDILMANGSNRFLKSINVSANFWAKWQGTWFSAFVGSLFNFAEDLNYEALGGALCFTIVITVIAVAFYVVGVCKEYQFESRKVIMPLLTLLLLSGVVLQREYKEVYLWWAGACTYLLPFGCMVAGLAFLRMGLLKDYKRYYVLSAVFLFLMSGGVLEGVGMGCFTALYMGIKDSINRKRLNKLWLVTFLISLAGAILNAAAPGNYIRHAAQGSEAKLSLLSALKKSVFCVLEENEWLLYETSFLVIIFIAFLLGRFIKKRIDKKEAIISAMYIVLLPVVTIFPVILGYNAVSVSELPDRVLFIFDASIVFSFVLFAMLLGAVVFQRFENMSFAKAVLLLLLASLIVFSNRKEHYREWVPVQIAYNTQYGLLDEYSDFFKNVYATIRDSEEEDVVIEAVVPEVPTGCIYNDIKDDPTDWVNKTIARIMEKKSVVLYRLW